MPAPEVRKSPGELLVFIQKMLKPSEIQPKTFRSWKVSGDERYPIGVGLFVVPDEEIFLCLVAFLICFTRLQSGTHSVQVWF